MPIGRALCITNEDDEEEEDLEENED